MIRIRLSHRHYIKSVSIGTGHFPSIKLGKADAVYLLAYAIWILLMIFNTSMYGQFIARIYTPVRYLCLGMLVISSIKHPTVTVRDIVGYAIASIIFFIALHCHDTVLIDCVLFILFSRDRDKKIIARLTIILTAFSLFVIIMSSLLGIIPNISGWSGGRQRSYLGFRYALYPANFMFLITCLVVFLKREKLPFVIALVLFVCNIFINYYTSSRLSFILSLFVILGALFLSFRQRRKSNTTHNSRHPFSFLFVFSFIFAALLTVFFIVLYINGNPFMYLIDSVELLGGRIGSSVNALRTIDLNLFGREMHFSGAAVSASSTIASSNTVNYNYIDNLFVKSTLNYGVAFTIIFLSLMTTVSWKAYKKQDYYLQLILVSIAVHCTIDNAMMYLYYNTFLLLIGDLLKRSKHMKKRKRYVPHPNNR